MATAAADEDRPAFDAARQSAARADRRFETALRGLTALGYEVD